MTDQWKLSFVPGEIISNISADIDCGEYTFPNLEPLADDQGYTNAGWGNGGWDTASQTQRQSLPAIIMKLGNLFGFKPGTKMMIKLTVSQRAKTGTALVAQEWMLSKVYPHIVPTVQRLMSAGHVLRIVLQAEARPSEKYLPHDFVAYGEGIVLDAMQTKFKLVSSPAASELIT